MKSVLVFLFVALSLNANAQEGFSCGQMFHFMQMKGFLGDVNFVSEIKKQAPKEMTNHLRFSGTAANYSNLSMIGYGMPSLESQIRNQKKQQPKRSYIYDFVDLYHQLGSTHSYFTFNSHQPYLGKQDLYQSILSLQYVNSNTNLALIELSNEAYLSIELLEINGNFNAIKHLVCLITKGKKCDALMKQNVNKFLDYLEFVVVPEIRKSGITAPISMELSKGRQDAHKIWNDAVLSRNFYDKLVIHTYVDGLTEKDIRKELDLYDFLKKRTSKPVVITEYGLSTGDVSKKELEAFQGSLQVRKDFVTLFNKVAKSYGYNTTHLHALWGNSKSYSFVNYKN